MRIRLSAERGALSGRDGLSETHPAERKSGAHYCWEQIFLTHSPGAKVVSTFAGNA